MSDISRGRRSPEQERVQRVGEVLVSWGKLTRKQLREALDPEKNGNGRPGEVLLSRNLVSEEDLARAVAEATGCEYVSLHEALLDPAMLDLVGEKALRRYEVLPLRVEGGRLVLAMSDPTNVLALDDLKTLVSRPIRPVAASGTSIRNLRDRALGARENIHDSPGAKLAPARSPADDASGISLGDEGAPVVRLANSIIRRALSEGASDIHLEPRAEELAVRYRIDGVLERQSGVPLKLKDSLVSRFKIMGDLDISEKRLPQDGRFSVEAGGNGQPVDVRVASLPSVRGEKIVLRLLTHGIVQASLEDIGLSPEALRIYRGVFTRPYGAVVVTGPTGSGKSTTLYTTLEELNDEERNIVTIEDPVEYRIEGITQIQTNPPAGLTFASGLRHMLRGDPDVVMVGEVRDHETAELFVEAALTGHMVLATLHTNDAAGALPRLTNMGIDPFLSASAIGCVVAQRLVRRLCEGCKEPASASKAVLRHVGFPFDLLEGELTLCKPVGCGDCRDGYLGRIGIYEVLRISDEVEALALARSSADDIGRTATKEGMVRMRADGLLKAARGITPIEEILRTTV